MTSFFLAGEPLSQGEVMNHIFHHALDSPLFSIGPLVVSRFSVMIAITCLVLLIMAWVMDRKSLAPKGLLRNAFEALMLFVRDEMTRPAMGRRWGDFFVPLFSTVFLFIVSLNLMGLVPLPYVGGTATASYLVTGTLAALMLLTSFVAGLLVNGPVGFFKSFIPGGVPLLLQPMLLILELGGFLIRHFVLMVRLFANMIAGHLVLGSFLGLIFLSGSYLTSLPSVGLAVFGMTLELLVAFIQAYVFTLLSVLFVGSVVHPEH